MAEWYKKWGRQTEKYADIGNVVDSLNLQFEYFSKGNVTGFTRREIYDKSPISIEFDNSVDFSDFSLLFLYNYHIYDLFD